MNLELWAKLSHNIVNIITQFQCIENTNVGNDVKQKTDFDHVFLERGASRLPLPHCARSLCSRCSVSCQTGNPSEMPSSLNVINVPRALRVDASRIQTVPAQA